jgi:quercetin dioxygenase-like cupin family protein
MTAEGGHQTPEFQVKGDKMPVIIKANETRLTSQGEGWIETTLADSHNIGTPAIVARRWSFEPYTLGPLNTHGVVEQLLYVIQGDGEVHVNGEVYPLEGETMLWLEPGDQYQFKAGTDGLEILQGYAPGE